MTTKLNKTSSKIEDSAHEVYDKATEKMERFNLADTTTLLAEAILEGAKAAIFEMLEDEWLYEIEAEAFAMANTIFDDVDETQQIAVDRLREETKGAAYRGLVLAQRGKWRPVA